MENIRLECPTGPTRSENFTYAGIEALHPILGIDVHGGQCPDTAACPAAAHAPRANAAADARPVAGANFGFAERAAPARNRPAHSREPPGRGYRPGRRAHRSQRDSRPVAGG